MTAIEKAIAESKAREEKATNGPWEILNSKTLDTIAIGFKSRFSIPLATMNRDVLGDREINAKFIVASRTWEPKWRQMVEKCLSILVDIQKSAARIGILKDCADCPEIHDYVDDLEEQLERLAKEGMGV